MTEPNVGDVLRLRRDWQGLPRKHWVVVQVGEKITLCHMPEEAARLTTWVIEVETGDLRRFDKLKSTMPVEYIDRHSAG